MPSDPANFRKMSEPFATSADADKAVDAFQAGLKKLRDECRIAEVFCIIEVPYLLPDGGEASAMARLHHGYQLKAPVLAAYGYGIETASHDAMIARLISQARKHGGSGG